MAQRLRLVTFLLVLVSVSLAQSQTFKTIHNFASADGAYPYGGFIQDSAGNLYGTTDWGGNLKCLPPNGCGLIFKMTTAGKETVLHKFDNSDGQGPWAPVVFDKAGNIYGTTRYGGSASSGTVFKIDTAGKETILHSFTGESDGCQPQQGLVVDGSGTVFGTTYGCGSSDYGTIFEVDSAGKFTLLHTFTGGPLDAELPQYGHLTIDKAGNLYGVTQDGGAQGYGVLYKLSKTGKLTKLHNFNYGTSDGCWPTGTVLLDATGNVYGTTRGCGSSMNGTIWKVSKTGKETILHNFAGGTSDGCVPYTGVTPDSEGNLYGVTALCGASGAYGALYELSAKGKLTLLHSFAGPDGIYPYGEVLRTTNGTLFGTTLGGGSGSCTKGCGTVWSYVP